MSAAAAGLGMSCFCLRLLPHISIIIWSTDVTFFIPVFSWLSCLLGMRNIFAANLILCNSVTAWMPLHKRVYPVWPILFCCVFGHCTAHSYLVQAASRFYWSGNWSHLFISHRQDSIILYSSKWTNNWFVNVIRPLEPNRLGWCFGFKQSARAYWHSVVIRTARTQSLWGRVGLLWGPNSSRLTSV